MREKMINVIVITNVKKEEIIKLDQDYYKVKVTALPRKGEANNHLVQLLAKYFNINKSRINIIQGEKNNKKLIYIKL